MSPPPLKHALTEPGSASSNPLQLSLLSRVHLDELLAEVLERVGDICRVQERHQALLDAVVGIAVGLDLRGVLERIVAAAASLAGARYGALGVLADDGRWLREFVTAGVSAQQRAQMGPLPEGHGLLGVLVEDPRPLRLRDLRDHPRAVGLPANHPPMTAFLGVPIRVGDRVFGNLYLTEKSDGSEFDDEDEEVVVALAAAAGVVIDNARLYERAAQRERRRAAEAEIAGLLLGETDRATVLALVARRARELAGADTAVIALGDDRAGQGRELRVEAVDGASEAVAAAMQLLDRFAGEVLAPGGVLRVQHEPGAGGRVCAGDARGVGSGALPVAVKAAAGVLAPLPGAAGVLAVVNSSDGRRAADIDTELVQGFAAQAALALERARSREDRAQLRVLEDRERIARDMHDLVIQRLFAAGLRLQGASQLAVQPELAERVGQVIDELDTVIADIRSVIFSLHSRNVPVDLADALQEVAAEAESVLGFAPHLDIGHLPRDLPAAVRDDAVAVLREALSNVARHAGASSVGVSVVADVDLQLTIVDDGVGLAGQSPERGLRNLRERARRHGGRCAVGTHQPHGTVVEWVVPARSTARGEADAP